MTWISLVCLLALSSSVYSRSVPFAPLGNGYGGALPIQAKVFNPMREFLPARPVVAAGYGAQGYGAEVVQPVVTAEPVITKAFNNYDATVVAPVTKVVSTGGYGAGLGRALIDEPVVPVAPVQVLTPADQLCRGQLPETVIPLDGGQRYVVCLDDSKGVEQYCQKGLVYVESLRRCERRTGPFDACANNPCLHGGVCQNIDYSYQCLCPAGYDGKNCELNALTCQSQQPCGVGPGVRCQSFRWNAALDYICVINEGELYGLNPTQVYTSPCKGFDGPHALAFTNAGFIMCDGERTFFESCPGGTIWDDLNKACVWPDMHPVEISGYGQRTLVAKTGYGGYGGAIAVETPKHHLISKVIDTRPVGYGAELVGPKVIDTRPVGYGAEVVGPRVIETGRPAIVATGGYGAELVGPKVIDTRPVGYGAELVGPKIIETGRPAIVATGGYGAELVGPKVIDTRPVGYGAELVGPKVIETGRPAIVATGGYGGYGAQVVAPRIHIEQPKVLTQYGGPREELVVKTSSY